MDDLIEALQIFRKYLPDDHYSRKYPTWCTHDVLGIATVEKDQVSKTDTVRLHEIGFFWAEEYGCFISFRFGSC